MNKKWKITLTTLFALFFLAPVIVGLALTHSFNTKTSEKPTDYGLKYENISFKSSYDDLTLRGWWIPSETKTDKTIVVSHGFNDERSQQQIKALRLMKTLHNNGYNILMFDYRNSGTSEGYTTSVGYFEQHDLKSAINFVVNDKKQKRVALLGWSMGASTSLMVGSDDPHVKAIIADSPFANLKDYLDENLTTWTLLPKIPFTPMILFSLQHLLGIDTTKVSPYKAVEKENNKAYFIIHSKGDEKIPVKNGIKVYKHIKSANKQIWLTGDIPHYHTFVYERKEYEKRVLSFLANNL